MYVIVTYALEYAFLSSKVNLATGARSVGKSCGSDLPGIAPGSGEFGMRRNPKFLKFVTFSLVYFQRKGHRMVFRRFP